jgi:hypothetical protein
MKLRRPSGALAVSIAVHMVVAVIFIEAIMARHPFFTLFGKQSAPPVVERVDFAVLPHARPTRTAPATPGRVGGDGRTTNATETVRPVAPITIPDVIPVAPKGPPVPGVQPSTGPLVGGGGALRGIQPRFEDPRVWARPGEIAQLPKTPAQRLDSVIASDIGAYNDSVRVAAGANKRAPGDWTFEKGGHKYGVDSRYIRLGPVSIPTALLALLPLNVTGNPTTYQRNKTLNSRHDEIFEQARRGMNDADFDKAVKSIRERKERERREAAAEKKRAEEASRPE